MKIPSTKDTIGCAYEPKQPPVPKIGELYCAIDSLNTMHSKMAKLLGEDTYYHLNLDKTYTLRSI
jgi:hypothetical protein